MMKIHFAILLIALSFSGTALADIEGAIKNYRSGRYELAYNELKKYSDRGYSDADSILALMYANGEGVPKDVRMAAKFAEKAIEGGNKESYALLATIYASDKSELKDLAKAVKIYEEGVKEKDPNCMRHLGLMYLNGEAVPQDFEKAYKLLKKASDYYDALSMYELGQMFEYGRGVAKDHAKALEWYRAMSRAPNGLVRIAQPKQQFKIAHLLEQNPKNDRDLLVAFSTFERLADQGSTAAMLRLGQMYESGRGTDINFKKAATLYEKAADRGNAKAAYHGGLLFENGRGFDVSHKEALLWFQDAAGLGSAEAMRKVARYFDFGLAVPIDHENARRWNCKASFIEARGFYLDYQQKFPIALPSEQMLSLHLALLNDCTWDDDDTSKFNLEIQNFLRSKISVPTQASLTTLIQEFRATKNTSALFETELSKLQ